MSEQNGPAEAGSTVENSGNVTEVNTSFPPANYNSEQNTNPSVTPEVDLSSVPDKFKVEGDIAATIAKLTESYTALEQKLHGKVPEPTPDPTPEPTGAPDINLKPEETPTPSGETFSWDTVDLSQPFGEDTAKLLVEQAGIPQELVDKVQEAFKVQGQIIAYQLAEELGGRAELDSVIKHARENFSEQKLGELDQILSQGNTLASVAVLRQIQAEMQNANPPAEEEGTLLEPDGSGGGDGLLPFDSAQEMTEALRDPRYDVRSSKYEKAYYEETLKRMALSGF